MTPQASSCCLHIVLMFQYEVTFISLFFIANFKVDIEIDYCLRKREVWSRLCQVADKTVWSHVSSRNAETIVGIWITHGPRMWQNLTRFKLKHKLFSFLRVVIYRKLSNQFPKYWVFDGIHVLNSVLCKLLTLIASWPQKLDQSWTDFCHSAMPWFVQSHQLVGCLVWVSLFMCVSRMTLINIWSLFQRWWRFRRWERWGRRE